MGCVNRGCDGGKGHVKGEGAREKWERKRERDK